MNWLIALFVIAVGSFLGVTGILSGWVQSISGELAK